LVLDFAAQSPRKMPLLDYCMKDAVEWLTDIEKAKVCYQQFENFDDFGSVRFRLPCPNARCSDVPIVFSRTLAHCKETVMRSNRASIRFKVE
jgi:hypothetical protein